MATYRYPTRTFGRQPQQQPEIFSFPPAGAGGTAFTQSLTGTLSFVGVQSDSARKALSGTLSFVGALPRRITHALTAALSFVGALTKRITHSFSGALSFVGAFVKRTIRSFSGALSFNLNSFVELLSSDFESEIPLQQFFNEGVAQSFVANGDGQLASADFFIRNTGVLTTGLAVAKLYDILGGADLFPSGAALATSDNFDVSALSTDKTRIKFIFTGDNRYQLANSAVYCVSIECVPLTGEIAVSATLDSSQPGHSSFFFDSSWWPDLSQDLLCYVYTTSSFRKKPFKVLNSTLGFVGSQTRAIRKAITAALSFAGTLAASLAGGAVQYAQSLTATLSFGGNITKRTTTALAAATLSFAVAFSKSTRKSLTAALSFIGALTKSLRRSLAGTLSFVGVSARKALKVFSGTLSFIGAIRRAMSTHLASALSFIGDLATFLAGGAHQYAQSLTATLSFNGTITKRTARAMVAAALSFAGATLKRAGKALSGSVGFAGVIRRAVAPKLSSSLAFIGTIRRSISAHLASALSFVVAFLAAIPLHVYTVALDATLNFAGAFSKLPNKTLTAVLNFSGALTKAVAKGLDSILCLCGRILTTGKLLLDAVISSRITTDAFTSVALAYDTTYKAMLTFAAIILSKITGKPRPIVKPCQCEDDE